jgi:hypothetical protein
MSRIEECHAEILTLSSPKRGCKVIANDPRSADTSHLSPYTLVQRRGRCCGFSGLAMAKAQLGILLVDLQFTSNHWWQTQGLPNSRGFGLPVARCVWPRATATLLTRLTLVGTWHTLRANPCTACLLGITSGVAEVIRALSLSRIELLAKHLHRYLRPRWEDQPTVWRHLLLAAQTEDSHRHRELCLKSLRLLAGKTLNAQSPSTRSSSGERTRNANSKQHTEMRDVCA